MKKTFALFLILVFAFSFSACGGDTTNDKTPAEAPAEAAAVAEPAPVAASEAVAEPAPTEAAGAGKIANIAETVIYNANDVVVTAKALRYDGWMGPEIGVLIENNSGQNITVQTRSASVNGLMVETVFSADVAAGKKANDAITLLSSDLEVAGIQTIQEMELRLYLMDADSWDEIALSDVIVLTTDAAGAAQTFDDSGFVAYDENGIKIVAKKLNSSDSFWGAELYLYIENNTETDVTVQIRDASIDGFMVEPIFSCELVHGKKAFDNVVFMEDDLQKNGITDIGSIEMCFHIFDSASWDTLWDSDPITITFPG